MVSCLDSTASPCGWVFSPVFYGNQDCVLGSSSENPSWPGLICALVILYHMTKAPTHSSCKQHDLLPRLWESVIWEPSWWLSWCWQWHQSSSLCLKELPPPQIFPALWWDTNTDPGWLHLFVHLWSHNPWTGMFVLQDHACGARVLHRVHPTPFPSEWRSKKGSSFLWKRPSSLV